MRLSITFIVLLALPAALHAQIEVSAGAGLLGTRAQILGDDAHVQGAVTWFRPLESFGLRIDALAGTEPAFATSGTVLLRKTSGAVRPYFLGGISYQNSERSSALEFAQEAGLVYGAGLQAVMANRTWFIEVTPRIYGNVFSEGATLTMIPITVGLVF